ASDNCSFLYSVVQSFGLPDADHRVLPSFPTRRSSDLTASTSPPSTRRVPRCPGSATRRSSPRSTPAWSHGEGAQASSAALVRDVVGGSSTLDQTHQATSAPAVRRTQQRQKGIPSMNATRLDEDFTSSAHAYEPHRQGLPRLRPDLRARWERRPFPAATSRA